MLTNCAFQLVFGKIYTCFRIKPVFLTSIVLFEVGSALCGAAPNSISFILGRSIAGLGAGGVLSGVVCALYFHLPSPSWSTIVPQPRVLKHYSFESISVRSCKFILAGYHRVRCSPSQASKIPGVIRGCFWHLLGDRATYRRGLYYERQLEMVFLSEPSLGSRDDWHRTLLAPYSCPAGFTQTAYGEASDAQYTGHGRYCFCHRFPVPGPRVGWHKIRCKYWARMPHGVVTLYFIVGLITSSGTRRVSSRCLCWPAR